MADSDEGKMGIWMTSALVVGTVIGAGIFMLPVSLAPLGPNALWAWPISGIGILCIALALAQVSRLGGDGIQANIEREFGPTVAFLVAWSFWFSNWVAGASLAVGAAAALSFVGAPFNASQSVVPLAILCVVVLTIVNAFGVRAAGGLSILTVAIKVLPLLAVVWLFAERGSGPVPFEQLTPTPITFANVAAATALTFYALTGFENATAPVGKVRDAERTLPRAIFRGTVFVVVLYMAAGTAILLLLPANVIVNSPAPYADVLVSRWGNVAASLAALTIAVSAFGCLNGLILGTGELTYSLALRGDLPASLARTHGAGTPVAAQVVVAILMILLLLANSSRATASLFTFIILLPAAGILPLYAVGALAAWKANPNTGSRLIVGVALVFVLFAAYGVGLEANLWCLVLLAAGLAIRAVMHRLNSRGGSIPLGEAIPAAPPGSSA
ncbi:amino acid permease [Sphingomonas daechungensis]|uniref:APC family permease n=1 Tax=Sphingomonas daechungensis TaxID=1176646 RepID=A0ABX6SZR7_9SPHN|nr:APC family permease [Sphingomonas daechungensis]QNP42920.1 APC family permease [Sphingomonas daechungensis]